MTVMFASLTSAVLICAMAVAFFMAQSQYKTNMDALFSSGASSIIDKLENNTTISDAWLAEQESESLCVISIEDNGTALHFKGAWLPQTPREQLFEMAKTAAKNAGFGTQTTLKATESTIFTLNAAKNESYKTCVGFIPKGEGKVVTLLILQDISTMHSHLRGMGLMYALVALAGVALLAAISCRSTRSASSFTKNFTCFRRREVTR